MAASTSSSRPCRRCATATPTASWLEKCSGGAWGRPPDPSTSAPGTLTKTWATARTAIESASIYQSLLRPSEPHFATVVALPPASQCCAPPPRKTKTRGAPSSRVQEGFNRGGAATSSCGMKSRLPKPTSSSPSSTDHHKQHHYHQTSASATVFFVLFELKQNRPAHSTHSRSLGLLLLIVLDAQLSP